MSGITTETLTAENGLVREEPFLTINIELEDDKKIWCVNADGCLLIEEKPRALNKARWSAVIDPIGGMYVSYILPLIVLFIFVQGYITMF